jgi:hypothetical protein
MAVRQILAGQTMLFWPEDQAKTASSLKLLLNERSQRRERDDGLLRLAIREGASADDESALGNCLRESLGLARALEQFRRSDRGLCLAPMRLKRRNHSQPSKSKVCHRTRGRSNIERVSRRDKNDIDPVTVGFS